MSNLQGPPADRRQFPPAGQSPGSQTSLRKRNQQRVVETLMRVGASTQADLARRTGLSTATISNIVTYMAKNGMVSLTPTTSSGRRAVSVQLITQNGTVAAGIGFGRRHLRVVLVYPDYTIAAEENVVLEQKYDPRHGFDVAKQVLTRLMEQTGVSWEALSGVGVGIPGSIDRRDLMPVIGTVWAEWAFVDVVVELEDRLGVPVVLDNDANLGSVAETIWGLYGGTRNLVYLKVGSGIGAGLILNGQPFNGATGVTGEVGHVQVVPDGQACRCGNRGCLEAEASITAMLDRLGTVTPIQSTEQLVASVQAGDVAALRVIEDAGRLIGRVVGDLASIISPEVIVLGGPLAVLGDTLLEPISRSFARHVLPLVRDATEIVASTLDDRGEALGAAALVFHQAAVRVI
ncbi:ROK family transcriptional regulator [Frondihabitans sp. PhB188]|uniref:ROK family transcriptional regulator n=1 Tax=Frondihabitans sp. PhB188 TaxID=2485200 RepID=UPI001F1E08F5|nr:ROK family transcriptional regulator [Frondihabitans sp. PhB188]